MVEFPTSFRQQTGQTASPKASRRLERSVLLWFVDSGSGLGDCYIQLACVS